MRQMDACIPEANPGKRCGQHHLAERLAIIRLLDHSNNVLAHHFDSLRSPDVAYRIRTLIGWPQSGGLWSVTLIVGQRLERLQSVTRTSKPVHAATILGSVRVLLGSSMPIAGLRYLWEMPVLTCISTKSNMATPVVSLA